ncbi:HAD domain-containing protein [Rhodoferax ferrireducens]|uniref:HAD domain-containing protein n=1 Tax=Rhodoferax ferrireducens TaxID=192843 RepID=UPI000E0CEA86|nr:HAD domain-containing protein [Rhodoferax ferrireducens]
MKGTGHLLLYLDFDGVLHHENCLWHPTIGPYLCEGEGYVLFQHCELLEKMLEPYPYVQIVLSTMWVVRYGCAKSAKNLRPALRQRVVGATYHSRMSRAEFVDTPRGLQVWQDVMRRKPRDWLALDDVHIGWPEHALPHYARTHKHAGISDPAVQAEFKQKLKEMCA